MHSVEESKSEDKWDDLSITRAKVTDVFVNAKISVHFFERLIDAHNYVTSIFTLCQNAFSRPLDILLCWLYPYGGLHSSNEMQILIIIY